MPRNPPRNAFYYFMIDFKERHGRKFNSLKEVADAAGPHWKNLSKEQRKPYEQQALKVKGELRPSRYTSDGHDVQVLEEQERLEQIKIQEMKDNITRNIHIASETGMIKDELFFIIHVNIFCFCEANNRYYPGEISITCFSLEDGVLPQNVFHKIINPGPLPLGYASEAKLLSEQTHQLPPPLCGNDESNIAEVFTEMKLFLSNKLSGSKRYPPLYADEKMIKMIQAILDDWCYDFEEEKPLFTVYNLQYMFRVLRNTVANETVWHTDTYSAREIEKDVYAYTTGICCELHAVTDVIVHCSRSVSIRYAYIICDNCCKDLGIILTPGAHIPDKALTAFTGTRSNSTASLVSRSSNSSRLKTSIRDDDTDSIISFSSKSEWDNRSVVSESSTTTIDSEFPDLGFRKKKSASSNSQPRFSSTDSSTADQSSVRSYAGATGTSGPSWGPSKGLDNVASGETDFAMGRGRSNRAFNSNISDFPVLGGARGRGKRF